MTTGWTRRRFLAVAAAGATAAATRPAAAQSRTQLVIASPADATTMDPGRSHPGADRQLLRQPLRHAHALGHLAQAAAGPRHRVEERQRHDVGVHAARRASSSTTARPLTAEDVKAVYERNLEPRQDGGAGRLRDDRGRAGRRARPALRIVTKKPDPLMPVRMAQMGGYIYPGALTPPTTAPRSWRASRSAPAPTGSSSG